MQITTFAGGLVTNVAEHAPRGREAYAAYCRNCRSDKQGWLVRRDGMTRISSETDIREVFVHKSVILAVASGILKWARIGEVGGQLTFRDFVDGGYRVTEDPERVLNVDERIVFEAREDLVYIGTGQASFVVEVPYVPNVPTVYPFYTLTPTAFRVTALGDKGQIPEGNTDFGRQSVKLRLQFVRLDGTQEELEDHQGAYPGQRQADVLELLTNKVSVSEPSASISLNNVVTDTTGTGRAINDLDESAAENIRTTVDIELTSEQPLGTHIDVYRSERNIDLSDEVRDDWYWLARFPTGQQTLRFTFELTDSSVRNYPELVPTSGDMPNFQYADTNEFRLYAATPKSSRVWLSYYNAGTAEKLYQTFTDFIDLDLGEGTITGLKFIRDNLLVVYATNQIQIITTDPLAELHTVIDFIAHDDVGNPIGCVAPDSIVDMGGEHFFLASNRYVYRFNSRTARTISDPVQSIFDATRLPITETGEPEITRAVAFAYQKDYFISIPSGLESDVGRYPNTTLMFDTEYRRWWQDSYAVRAVSKGYPERLYSVIDGSLFELFFGETDAGTNICRVWRSNPSLRRTHDKFRSVHVYAMGAAVIDVLAKTEQGEERGTITIIETSDVWSQRLGVNLRGRNFTVEISTESDAPIDRILVNEMFRS